MSRDGCERNPTINMWKKLAATGRFFLKGWSNLLLVNGKDDHFLVSFKVQVGRRQYLFLVGAMHKAL